MGGAPGPSTENAAVSRTFCVKGRICEIFVLRGKMLRPAGLFLCYNTLQVKSMRHREKLLRAVFGCAAAAGLVWFLIPLHWRVANAGSLAGVVFCAAVLCACLLFPKLRSACAQSRAVRRAVLAVAALFCAALLWAAAMTGCMLSAAAARPPEDAVVVVLGSKVSGSSPSADLRARIVAASEYL